jgi:membrane associated rhomboid family serine protease
MRRILMAVLGLLIGYPVFAFIGYWIIQLFSGNTFDRSMEADMTAVFAIGPLGAIVGLVAGLVLAGLKRKSETAPPGENI